MIQRIVCMQFKPENIPNFLEIFDQSALQIRQFNGCLHLQLHRDAQLPQRLFTVSHWESEAHLQAYRQSALFEKIWTLTKVLFEEKPQAWTLHLLREPS